MLYKKNLVSSSFSELYHANSTTSGDNATAYDNINRLTGFRVGTLSSSGNNGSSLDTVTTLNTTPHIYQETWALDALGNWSTLAQNSGSAVSNSFDKRNRETGFQGNTLTFDNNGNTTVDQSGQHYTYDAWNKIITIKNSAQTITLLSETHDALGRVATFNNTAGLQHWYYSNQNQVLEDQFSTVRQQYVWGQGYVNDLVLRDRNQDNNTSTGAYGKASSGLEERLYAQQDANYNVTTIIDPSQSIKERFVYDPYGGFTNLDSSWTAYTDTTWLWSYKFQGTYWEGIAGFYYMGARIYNPVLGTFLTEDPAGYIDSKNLYQAFNQNPSRYGDPSGMDATELLGDVLNFGRSTPSPDYRFAFGEVTNQKNQEGVGLTVVDDVVFSSNGRTGSAGSFWVELNHCIEPSPVWWLNSVSIVIKMHVLITSPWLPARLTDAWHLTKGRGWRYVLAHERLHELRAETAAHNYLKTQEINGYIPVGRLPTTSPPKPNWQAFRDQIAPFLPGAKKAAIDALEHTPSPAAFDAEVDTIYDQGGYANLPDPPHGGIQTPPSKWHDVTD